MVSLISLGTFSSTYCSATPIFLRSLIFFPLPLASPQVEKATPPSLASGGICPEKAWMLPRHLPLSLNLSASNSTKSFAPPLLPFAQACLQAATTPSRPIARSYIRHSSPCVKMQNATPLPPTSSFLRCCKPKCRFQDAPRCSLFKIALLVSCAPSSTQPPVERKVSSDFRFLYIVGSKSLRLYWRQIKVPQN